MKSDQLIGVINVESHSVNFSVLTNANAIVLAEASRSVDLIEPQLGWVEVDAEKIWDALCATIEEVIEQLQFKNVSKDYIKVIGIINERETVLAWNSESHKPLYNAIHYTDTRTDIIIEDYKSRSPNVFNEIEKTSGLKVTSIFSGAKLKWIINNNIKPFTTTETIRFGTLDTWLVWKLTEGKLYITDVTNASRTLLMNLQTLDWSPQACKVFNIPITLLPEIKSSSEKYGIIEETGLKGIVIGSIFANHQAALYGLNLKKPGQVMSRYGDSCTVSCITGTEFINSNNGLLTTIAYKIGNEPTVYAFEGWTSFGGNALDWLKINMNIISSTEEIQSLNIGVSDVYFVPAFNGLVAPHWKPQAKGIICGMTHFTNKNHLVRAALEALCFHTKDVCVSFKNDVGIHPWQLYVDGPYSVFDNLLRYQADILGIDVIRSPMIDMAVYGSAKAAAVSINVEFENHKWTPHITKPTTKEEERIHRHLKWLKAIKRSIGVARTKSQVTQKMTKYDILSTNVLSTAYLVAWVCMIAVSVKN